MKVWHKFQSRNLSIFQLLDPMLFFDVFKSLLEVDEDLWLSYLEPDPADEPELVDFDDDLRVPESEWRDKAAAPPGEERAAASEARAELK